MEKHEVDVCCAGHEAGDNGESQAKIRSVLRKIWNCNVDAMALADELSGVDKGSVSGQAGLILSDIEMFSAEARQKNVQIESILCCKVPLGTGMFRQ